MYSRNKGDKFISFLEKLEEIDQVGMYANFLNNLDPLPSGDLSSTEHFSTYYATSELFQEYMRYLPARVTAGFY